LLGNVYIIIPAKDEGTRIGGVLEQLRKLKFRNVIVVNDGSSDNTAAVAKKFNATVLNHFVNLGAGAATQTGIDFAVKQNAEIIVTIDADHQHQPKDILNLVNTLREQKSDVVIGSRFIKDGNKIPFLRIIYNKIANVLTYLITGVKTTDSQSGMKAFNQKFAKNTKINFNGFEFSVEMIKNIKLTGAKVAESPIHVVYTKDTLSKGQNFLNGVKMLSKLARLIGR